MTFKKCPKLTSFEICLLTILRLLQRQGIALSIRGFSLFISLIVNPFTLCLHLINDCIWCDVQYRNVETDGCAVTFRILRITPINLFP